MDDSIETKKTKRKFSKQEDLQLLSLVGEYGTKDWNLISGIMISRSSRQCRERWIKYLAPGNNTRPWTQEEDDKLIKLHSKFGRKWKTISAFFIDRTDISVKNRFIRLERSCRNDQYQENIENNDSVAFNHSILRVFSELCYN